MHVVEPARYQTQPRPRSRRRFIAVALLILLALAIVNYVRPLPAATASVVVTLPSAAATSIAWPSTGQAAIAADGYGLLGTNGSQTPLATASIAKVIAALCVLQKQPLGVNQSGPSYTVGAADVALYQSYAAQDGSLIPVTEGEQLTEYQALEAMMLPSANNIADSLTRWVFGSQAAYNTYATAFLAQNGLSQTTIGSDASGFDPSTVSTASDLTSLGLLALKSPVLLQIAGQSSTTLPVAGTVYNYDTALGQDGITGLKTGNNDADPGAFLFTAIAHIGNQDIPITGAVMGAPDLSTALSGAKAVSASMQQDFEQDTLSQAGQTIGHLQTAWGVSVPITTAKSLQVIRWKATPLTEAHQLHPEVRAGEIGSIKVSAGQVQTVSALNLAHTVAGPSFWWRLTRH